MMVHNTMHYLKLHYLELILNMVERGWSVTCVAPVDAAVSELERIGAGCVDLALSRKGMNPLREVASVVKLYSILKRERPDMVLNFSIKPAIYGSIAARLAGIQRVCSMITGLGYVFLGQGPARRLLASLAAAAYKLALSSNRRVFFQNPDDARFFIQRGIVDPSQALVLAGTGIDTDRFHPGPAETPAKAQDGRVGYLLVGRLLADKGVREYVAAARALKAEGKPARCALLGPFDDNPAAIPRAEVERWVRDGLIEYLGETDDVAGALNNYDVFVLPSYREGLPRRCAGGNVDGQTHSHHGCTGLPRDRGRGEERLPGPAPGSRTPERRDGEVHGASGTDRGHGTAVEGDGGGQVRRKERQRIRRQRDDGSLT